MIKSLHGISSLFYDVGDINNYFQDEKTEIYKDYVVFLKSNNISEWVRVYQLYV